jgi:hypothetical protein
MNRPGVSGRRLEHMGVAIGTDERDDLNAVRRLRVLTISPRIVKLVTTWSGGSEACDGEPAKTAVPTQRWQRRRFSERNDA